MEKVDEASVLTASYRRVFQHRHLVWKRSQDVTSGTIRPHHLLLLLLLLRLFTRRLRKKNKTLLFAFLCLTIFTCTLQPRLKGQACKSCCSGMKRILQPTFTLIGGLTSFPCRRWRHGSIVPSSRCFLCLTTDMQFGHRSHQWKEYNWTWQRLIFTHRVWTIVI